MKTLKTFFITMITVLGTFTSCVELENTEFNIEETKTFFETEEDIQSAIVVVYDALAKGSNDYDTTNSTQGGVYDVPTILLNSGVHTYWGTRDVGSNSFSTQSADIQRMYEFSYFGISKANLVLEKVDGIDMSEENRNKYIGEVKFLRGLFYFNLVQYFGGVPLRMTSFSNTYEDSILPRSSAEEVYNLIIEDLQFAEQHLPTHDFDGDYGTGRATSGAASGLLAKVYLTMAGHPLNKGVSHFQLAKDQAQKVIDLGVYELQDDYSRIFHSDNENNKEWLFSVQFGPLENDQGNWGGWHNKLYNFDPNKVDEATINLYGQPLGGGYGRVSFTQEMSEAWHKNDPRRTLMVISIKANGKAEKAWKWKTIKFRFVEEVAAKNFTSVNGPVLRYADILLTLAEAENEINGPTALAYDAVNQVRARARGGMPYYEVASSSQPADLSGLDQDEFRDNMIWERARELCMEGLDRFDLVRSGRYYELTKDAVHVGKENKVLDPLPHFDLLPIPLTAIRNNTALQGHQNPGY